MCEKKKLVFFWVFFGVFFGVFFWVVFWVFVVFFWCFGGVFLSFFSRYSADFCWGFFFSLSAKQNREFLL